VFRDSMPMSNELSYCGGLGESDVVLHLKVASTIRRCEACGVMLFFSMNLSAWSCTNLVKPSCLLQVDSAIKCNDLAKQDESMFRLRSLHHRGLFVA